MVAVRLTGPSVVKPVEASSKLPEMGVSPESLTPLLFAST